MVEESHGEGVTLAEGARRHDISRSQLYDWRYRHKNRLLGAGPQFLRVLQVEDGSGPDEVPAPPAPVLTIDLGPRCRVTIPSGFDMGAAVRLLNGLMVRP